MKNYFPQNLRINNAGVSLVLLDEFPRPLAKIEMTPNQLAFLGALIEEEKPANILEVGVAAGGSSAFILHCIKRLGLDCALYSCDLQQKYYRNKSLPTGYTVEGIFGGQPENWKLFTGKYLAELIESFAVQFDLCLLDTVHSLPGELLDYLVVLPFMARNAVIVVHDTALHLRKNDASYATRLLMDVAVGEKITLPPLDLDNLNIGAIRINDDTLKYVGNIFMALTMSWRYAISPTQYKIYLDFFNRYYGSEAAEWFTAAKKFNEANLKQQTR